MTERNAKMVITFTIVCNGRFAECKHNNLNEKMQIYLL